MLEDFPLEISQRLICLVDSMRARFHVRRQTEAIRMRQKKVKLFLCLIT
jgi:hypothetical protein